MMERFIEMVKKRIDTYNLWTYFKYGSKTENKPRL
jgi:hypothetical protein